mmetsp:Transcript_93283/g.264074  ORF Transcript_93283/g.264074 Transcript_93283/m.264074 type:complete len:200 (+) Transcript_93283:223-822(+)
MRTADAATPDACCGSTLAIAKMSSALVRKLSLTNSSKVACRICRILSCALWGSSPRPRNRAYKNTPVRCRPAAQCTTTLSPPDPSHCPTWRIFLKLSRSSCVTVAMRPVVIPILLGPASGAWHHFRPRCSQAWPRRRASPWHSSWRRSVTRPVTPRQRWSAASVSRFGRPRADRLPAPTGTSWSRSTASWSFLEGCEKC